VTLTAPSTHFCKFWGFCPFFPTHFFQRLQTVSTDLHDIWYNDAHRASEPDRKLKFSTFENPRCRSLTDEHLTEQHWQPVFLFSKPIVSIHVCCSYIELSRSKLHKTGDLQVGNWHINFQHSSSFLFRQHRLQIPPTNFGAPPPNSVRKKHQNFDHFFATSALDTACLRNETYHRQTKILVSIYSVSAKRWSTFRDLWPRNGWDPFRHFDPSYRRPLRCNHHSCDMSISSYFLSGHAIVSL